jgi:hypothetical protein
MKALFRPTTRFRDLHPRPERLQKGFTEVELLPGLTVENIWATGITWEEFRRFLGFDTVMWMMPGVYVLSGVYVFSHKRNIIDHPLVLGLGGYDRASIRVHVRSGRAEAAATATATCDFLVRLLATCESHGVNIYGRNNRMAPSPLTGAALSLFFQESQICLRKVTLQEMALSEDQCRALATMSRLDIKVRISYCRLLNNVAGAFAEFLQSNRGPVELHNCKIDSRNLASALAGNSRVTSLTQDSNSLWVNDEAVMTILLTVLANNRGLVHLDLYNHYISDDNWTILCESLQAHPTLASLDLRNTMSSHGYRRIVLTDDETVHRTRLLAEMVQRNTALHTIILSEGERDEQIYAEMILPYLETNRYRPRVLAIKKTDISFRRPLLGRALQAESVRNDPNLLWLFVSGNPDVLVPSNVERRCDAICKRMSCCWAWWHKQ